MSDLASRLADLRQSANRSSIDRLRDEFDAVNAALEAGVSRADVHAALEASGFQMPFGWFCQALGRIRAERGITPPRKAKKISDTRKGASPSSAATNPAKPESGAPNPVKEEALKTQSDASGPQPFVKRFQRPEIDFDQLEEQARLREKESRKS